MKKDILFIISNKLKKLRESNLLTQNELCEIIEVNRKTYVNWEIGRAEIPLEKLDKLALFYKVNIDYIFDLNEMINNERCLNFEILSNNLKELIREKNLKIESLAIDAETTISTIWAYIHNKQKIRTIYLYRICKNNNISADYLLGKTDKPNYFS